MTCFLDVAGARPGVDPDALPVSHCVSVFDAVLSIAGVIYVFKVSSSKTDQQINSSSCLTPSETPPSSNRMDDGGTGVCNQGNVRRERQPSEPEM